MDQFAPPKYKHSMFLMLIVILYLLVNSVYKILPNPIVFWIYVHNRQYLIKHSFLHHKFTFCVAYTYLSPQAVFTLIKSILPVGILAWLN